MAPSEYRRLSFDDRAEIEAYFELQDLKSNDMVRREEARRKLAQEQEERRRLLYAQSPAIRKTGGRI